MCQVKCLGGSGTAAFLHQFFKTPVLNFIIVTGRIGETHCIMFQHSRLFGFKLTLSLLPGCHDTLEIESVGTVWNWMFSCKSVQLFSFLTPNKGTFHVFLHPPPPPNFAPWIVKHYPVRNQAHLVILFPAYTNESSNLIHFCSWLPANIFDSLRKLNSLLFQNVQQLFKNLEAITARKNVRKLLKPNENQLGLV